ncbi:type II toxin-antitoxin system HicB family antitoxin [Thiohalocapsa halophila]|uniref:type II toxin-antitoxin system HicB family antitoxin n=1 Tax=Thiohalocapsa halophila TaxID=69359 RepID=UPI002ADD6B8E|nr:type II toxin-antitoxin system HicB family antitoxin [Thiohalocapsa halophila]
MRYLYVRYTVILEQSPTSVGAYVPDLPGCIAAADTKAEALQLIAQAVELHLEDLKARGEPIPEPHSSSETIEVAA